MNESDNPYSAPTETESASRKRRSWLLDAMIKRRALLLDAVLTLVAGLVLGVVFLFIAGWILAGYLP